MVSRHGGKQGRKGREGREKRKEVWAPAPCSEEADIFPGEIGLLLPLLLSFPCGVGWSATILCYAYQQQQPRKQA